MLSENAKSRLLLSAFIITVAAAELISTKSVPIKICNEPQHYITDVVKVKKVGRKFKKIPELETLVERITPTLWEITAQL